MNQIQSADAAAELPPQKSPFDAGIELYHLPRMEGESNLVEQVRGMLHKNGVKEEALSACYDGSRHIKAASDKNTVAQRYLINRFLNLTLNTAVKSSIDLRSELLPNGSVANWLTVVDTRVAPFIAQENLLV